VKIIKSQTYKISKIQPLFISSLGALSRTFAQTIMHPINTFKTILQVRGSKLSQVTPERLLRGADAQFLMSLPHGKSNKIVKGEQREYSMLKPSSPVQLTHQAQFIFTLSKE